MVATIHELASSATAVSYYEKDGYYAKNDAEHRKASFWHGGATAALGLRGHVVPSRFESVLSGRVPKSDVRLGRIVEGKRQHRPGWDITFSAPKSVSLEALVMGRTSFIRAHDEAVRATLDWIEKTLLQTRGWDPETKRRPRVKAHGMVVAGFRHLTSRDLDPQLHTHCVLANMTRNAHGEWRSLEPALLKRNEKLIGAHYRNELASRLLAQGVALTPRMIGPVPGFELAGYDQEFLDAFSGRRREILAYLDRHGLPHARAATQKATLHTRRRKVEAGLADLVPQWRERARALGLGRDERALMPPRPADPVTDETTPVPRHEGPVLTKNERRKRRRAPALPEIGAGPVSPAPATRPAMTAPPVLVPEAETGVLEAVARAIEHFEERRTVIPVHEIRAMALGSAPGRYGLDEIDRELARLVAAGDVRETAIRGRIPALVTARAVKAERRLLELLREAEGESEVLAPAEQVEERLAGTTLTEGQKDAVRRILISDDAIVGVQGRAGTGKTTMLREVKELLGATPVFGLAPSAAAARVLGREAGIDSRTLQWFLVRHGDLADSEKLEQARALYGGAVLAVDEASMIGTVQMEQLLRIAKALGVARVVLTGDTAQLKSITAGQPFRLLQQGGMATAVMDEVLRQKDADLKVAVEHAREGEAREAFGRLANRVVEHVREDLGREAGRRWLAMEPGERQRCAVLAPTHEIRRAINETVRDGLEDEGVLHGEALTIERLVDRRFTRQQASMIENYEVGDTIVFHRDVYGCLSGDVCVVSAITQAEVVLDHDDGEERRFRPSGNASRNLAVCETARIEIRAGDRIRWTRNRKASRSSPALVNGEEAQVLGIERQRVRMMNAEGNVFSLKRDDPQLRHLDHAYSSTVHGAQGRTAPKVIAVLNAGGMANQEMFYVEVSRASEGFMLLTDDREALVERLEASWSVPDGALEALGEDLDPPVVDPEELEAVMAAWSAVEDHDGPPASTPGYAEAMARVAALAAIEDLPDDVRAFTDARLAEHAAMTAAEQQVRSLIADLQTCWRRWPELNWAADAKGCDTDELEAWQDWRDAGTALLEKARSIGEAAPPEVAMAAAGLERARLKDDAALFTRRWSRVREDGPLPWTLEDLGARLGEAPGLAEDERRALAEWQVRIARERAIAGAAGSFPDRVTALVARAPDAGAGAAWQGEAQELLNEARALAAAGESLAEPVATKLTAAVEALEDATLAQRTTALVEQSLGAGVLPLDDPAWRNHLEAVRHRGTDPGGALAMNTRWRRMGERIAGIAERLRRLEADRPRFGHVASERWRAEAVAVPAELATVEADVASDEREAWRRTLNVADLDDLARRIPAWQETAATLDRLAAWQVRVEATLGANRTDGWQGAAKGLAEEGLALAGASDGMPDMEGAAAAIHADRARIAEALQADAIGTFNRLTRSVNAEAKAKGIHWLDTTDCGVLREAISRLRRYDELPARTAELVADWQAALPRWEAERENVTRLASRLRALDPDARLPLADVVRREADDVLPEAEKVPSGAWALHGAADVPAILEALPARLAADRVARLEAERRAADIKAFNRLTRSVNAEAKAKGIHELDTADCGVLRDVVARLRRHDELPARTEQLMTEWDDALKEWDTERREVTRLAGWLARLDLEGPVTGAAVREADDALAAALALPSGAWARHGSANVPRILERLPAQLETARRESGRRDHLAALAEAVRRIEESRPVPTLSWDNSQPLVRGDRLRWFDSGRRDMIVEKVDFVPGDEFGLLWLRPPGSDATESVRAATFTEARRAQRVAWPDETLRQREIERQFAHTDDVYRLVCDARVVAGDHVRWTMTNDVDGDTPQVEARVEHIERGLPDDTVTLTVIRSWGLENAPAPGATIRVSADDLAERGCVRKPWQDEELRAETLARQQRRGRSMSM